MRAYLIVICIFALLMQNYVWAEQVKRMECDWSIPARFTSENENVWRAPLDDMAIIYFKPSEFDPAVVENSIGRSIRVVRKAYAKIDNGYEFVIFNEFIEGIEDVVFPSWVVVKDTSRPGVFYLNGLSPSEIMDFIAGCMPGVE